MLIHLLPLLASALFVNAQGAGTSFSPTPVTTAVATATVAADTPVAGQGDYPPPQPLCNGGANDTFCPGVLLQDVELAGIFPDSKTFVDKPTNGTLEETLAAFNALPANKSIGEIETFVDQYFKGEGLELEQVALEGFNANPAVLDDISDPVFKAWVGVVNSYWQLLIRETNDTAVCKEGTCESSLVPLNYTIVVPGGRYRETYYWDTFWIVEGLLRSELYTYAWDVLQNFMDLIDMFGFIPNGGRKYYLNRSQPPVFIQMVDAYIKATGNITILERALPAMTTEMTWWLTNRSIEVTSPFTGKTHSVYHYDVSNTAPRPEGYAEDYATVSGTSPALNETAKGDLYGELATGAESGYDYSVRWCKQQIQNLTSNDPILRTLNVKAIVPVDLNSLLAGDHALLAGMYDLHNNAATSSNKKRWYNTAEYHREVAANLTDAVLDLNWDPAKSWFYDFNTSDSTRSSIYTAAGTFPLWQNITPPEVKGNETAALQIVSGARFLLGFYSGLPSVASLIYTGLNWDFPNSWPPHAYTTIKAMEALGRAVPNASSLSDLTVDFSAVAAGQFGLEQSELQPQPQATVGNSSLQVQEAEGKPWPLQLSIEYANRYLQSSFCSWYSTGGEIDGILSQLPLSDLNSTGTYTAGQTGVMFEKFNVTDIDAAGGGGEYTVQIGFGWTNGVVLWAAGEYGKYLPQPTCPLIPIIEVSDNGNHSIYDNGTVSNGKGMFAGYKIPSEGR